MTPSVLPLGVKRHIADKPAAHPAAGTEEGKTKKRYLPSTMNRVPTIHLMLSTCAAMLAESRYSFGQSPPSSLSSSLASITAKGRRGCQHYNAAEQALEVLTTRGRKHDQGGASWQTQAMLPEASVLNADEDLYHEKGRMTPRHVGLREGLKWQWNSLSSDSSSLSSRCMVVAASSSASSPSGTSSSSGSRLCGMPVGTVRLWYSRISRNCTRHVRHALRCTLHLMQAVALREQCMASCL